MLNVLDKFPSRGMPLPQVVAASTRNRSREIHREELGNFSPGSVADVAVLRRKKGNFGFNEDNGAGLKGNQKFACELTLRDGKVVSDLNAITRTHWDKLPEGDTFSGGPSVERSTGGGRRPPFRR